MLYSRLLFALIIFPLYLFSQNNYAFQHLTIEDGLLSNKANIFQDAEGFYWFANVTGLQRFDGKNFITYKFQYSPSKLIKADDWVNQLTEDNEKNIWLTNSEGINIFYRKEAQLRRLYMPDALDSNANNVVAIIKDNQQKLWIITTKNIFNYDYDLHKPVLYSNILPDKSADLQTVQYDKTQNCFWILVTGSTHRIARFNIAQKQISYPVKETVDTLLGGIDQIPFFKLDESENLWIANYIGDFCRYNVAENKLTHYTFLHQRSSETVGAPNSRIVDCIDDKNGSVWFSGDYYLGLLQYDKNADKFYQQQNNNGSEYGFHYNQVTYNFFEDNEKNIWINTDLGMNIFNPQAQVFKYLNMQPGSFVTQFSSDISSIFQNSSGNIWISTWGDGIFQYSSDFKLLNHYVHEKTNPASFGERLNRAWCFAEDNKGRLWIGCQHGLLSVFDTAKKQFTNIQVPAFKTATVMHAIKTKNNIWFGLYSGLIGELNESTGEIKSFENVYYNSLNMVSPVDGICADRKENIWWSPGANGIREFDAQKNFVVDSMLFPIHISTPVFLNDSVMMGGTDAKGFFILNTYTKSAQFFNTSNGLSTNDVFGVIPSGNNEVWVIANDGIKLFNLSKKTISDFNINDGIRDHELQGAFCRLKNGIIMFASKSGVIYFNPDDIKPKSPPPDVCITGFSINGRSYSVDSLLTNKTISLSHNQNAITIEYASLSFSGRETNTYFYELSGVDKDWISAATRRSVTYANLSPGNYIFKVKSENSDGIETKNITVFNILIHPPWWQTWWAYIIWLLIILFIVYTVYAYRKRNRNALAAVRQKIANDLHDDIGSTLNSISVYSEVASQQLQSNTENVKNILQKMGGASRNMIDTMNDIVWSVNPKNDQFENILQRMKYFAGELLSGKNILLQFNADEKLKSVKLSMDKRKNFYLIFKEALNNACKYSKAKQVSVNIADEAGKLMMMIKDDGIGFDENNIHAGNGLKNMQARAEEMNARLNIQSKLNEGTKIELVMQVN
jgi:ligand-binding sensor domain-containing protein/two-component sensor histidine kinase